MSENPPQPPRKRNSVVWLALIPQLILLTIAIIWISLSPKDNITNYLNFKLQFLLTGLIVGLGLAFAGYIFYKVAQHMKVFHSTVELFEEMLAPTFRNLKILDIIILSSASGFCEEVFFRGLLQPKIGIIAASIAFGLLHLPGLRYWFYAMWATMSGVILGTLLIVTGSLWTSIIAHAVNNVTGVFI
jgi:uncharacterized protein